MESDANIPGGRFVLAIKNVVNDQPAYKARFFVQRLTDNEKKLLVKNAKRYGNTKYA